MFVPRLLSVINIFRHLKEKILILAKKKRSRAADLCEAFLGFIIDKLKNFFSENYQNGTVFQITITK